MKRWTKIAAGVVTMALLAGVPAFGQSQQQQQRADCQAPAKVDGQVVSVDPNTNKVTVKDKGGATHEFQTSKETAQTMKPGDKIEATLRQPPQC